MTPTQPPKKRQKFSPDEDAALLEAVEKFGFQWSRIADTYGRQGGPLARRNQYSLKDRCRTLKKDRIKNGDPLGVLADLHLGADKNRVEKEAFAGASSELLAVSLDLEEVTTCVSAIMNIPETHISQWTPTEDEILMNAYLKLNGKWKDMAAACSDLLRNHVSRRDALRSRVLQLQKQQVRSGSLDRRLSRPVPGKESALLAPCNPTVSVEDLLGTCADSERPLSSESVMEDVEPVVPGVICPYCNEFLSWKTLLTEGLKCSCRVTLREMQDAVQASNPWAVYIVLHDPALGLAGRVEYVGFSKQLKKRAQAHEKKCVREATFENLRVSLLLGENQLISLLRPVENEMKYSGIQESYECWTLGTPGTRSPATTTRDVGSMYNAQKWALDKPLLRPYGEDAKSAPATLFTPRRVTQFDVVQGGVGLLFSQVSHLRPDYNLCFLERASSGPCTCKIPCLERKIRNGLQGRDVHWGIEPGRLRQNRINPYRPGVKSFKGGNEPSLPEFGKWEEGPPLLEFFLAVVDRNTDVTEKTRKTARKNVEDLAELGLLTADMAAPWEVMKRLADVQYFPAISKFVDTIYSVINFLSVPELRFMFGKFGPLLRSEYQMARQTLLDVQEDIRNSSALLGGKLSPRNLKNWAMISELEDVVHGKFDTGGLTLYRLQPFLWLAVALKLRVVRDAAYLIKISNYAPDVDDYIDGDRRLFVFNATEPKRSIAIPDSLWPILSAYIDRRLEKKVHFLYVNTKGEPFNPASFSQLVIKPLAKALEGRRVGVQQLKKILMHAPRLTIDDEQFLRAHVLSVRSQTAHLSSV
jgi:Myb-like DNA-binding protein